MKNLLTNPHLFKTQLFINGEWIDNQQEKITVYNPLNQDILAKITTANKNEIENTILIAINAQKDWQNKSGTQRSEILEKWYSLIIKNTNDLAKIITLESGKPFKEAKSEVLYGASFVKFYSEEAKRIKGETIELENYSKRGLLLKKAIGVCGIITPWNFPNAMLTRKVAPALAAGCSVVVKPSSQTPLSATALTYLAQEAGIPRGVFNLIHGDNELISDMMCSSDKIRKISFTGSTEVGIKLYEKSAHTLKKLSLELGGNSPFIVCNDANIDNAIIGLMQSKFRNAGQTCVCTNRVFVHDRIYDEFIQKLEQQVKSLKIGDGLDENVDIGPLINQQAVKKSNILIKDAISNGAKIILGGKIYGEKDQFLMPTILSECTKQMKIFGEEIFAPIIALYKFDTIEEAIELANDTNFGLASYVYTQNINNLYNIAERLDYGIVGINSGLISSAYAPFGGIKHSGFGKEGGSRGIDEYLIEKYICLDIS